MKELTRILMGVLAIMAMASAAQALTIVPQSALGNNGGQYYTDLIGGGIGDVVVMTGGGSSSNVGGANGRNDDGFSGPIDLGFTSSLSFYGASYNSFYANNNGNISFNSGISSYVPSGPTGTDSPVVSVYFADVDTRNALSGVMHLRTDVTNQVIVTWDAVGYYNSGGDLLNSFQLVLRGPDYVVPEGEGFIGFFYKGMAWETTATSTTAAVGFGDGAGEGVVLAGSNEAGLVNVLNNRYIWFNQDLTPIPSSVPEPSTLILLGVGLGSLGFARKYFRK
jgi:hypothetical protein